MDARRLLIGAVCCVSVAAAVAGCSSAATTAGYDSTRASSSSTTATPSAVTKMATPGSASTSAAPQTPAPETESNPPGDIPDNQVFIGYQGVGFSVQVPEGWASSTAAGTTTFTDKLNSIAITPGAQAGSMTQAEADAELAGLASSVPAFAPGQVQQVTRAGQQIYLLTYQGDSAADPVTNKVVRDAFERYVFVRAGQKVELTLSGPAGADNVDPWKTVSNSFTWAP